MLPVPASPGRWQTARITRILPLTARLKSFTLQPDAAFAWLPGQHVHIRLTAPDGYQARRSYSIASAPESGILELAVERLDEGEVSPFFHDVAAEGDAIELRGPIGGHFVWRAGDGPLLAVGGGSGIVPLVAMIRHRALAPSPPPALLLVSARTWDDIPFRTELLDLDASDPGLTVIFALTRAAQGARPADFARRIDGAMVADLLTRRPLAGATGFVCGANPFVEAVATALRATGFEPGRIRTERYGG